MRNFTYISYGLILLILINSSYLWGQTTWSGVVTDGAQPVVGANVYLQNTYSGATTDTTGAYSFTAEPTDTSYLVISAVGYQTQQRLVMASDPTASLNIQLQEASHTLQGVTISAGSFEAGDKHQAIALKPLDIVTTAGAMGDIAGALQTLPGTQTVGEDGRLFVRGGDGHETKVFIDGMLSHSPFNASVPGIPTRGRFSPFLFKGTTFNTGGYSAEYGQALSSALLLNTNDLAEQTQTDISLMTVGGNVSHQHRWDQSSVWVEGGYTDLTAYQWAVPQDVQWMTAPKAWSGSAAYRQKTSATGMMKLYTQASRSQLALHQPNVEQLPNTNLVSLENDNLYANASFQEVMGKKWIWNTGVSYTYDEQQVTIDQAPMRQQQQSVHAKSVGTYDLNSNVAIRVGAEYFQDQYDWEMPTSEGVSSANLSLVDRRLSQFVETDAYLTKRLVSRLGVRTEYAKHTDIWNASPRASLAYKTGKDSQVSLSYGTFNQSSQPDYRLINADLTDERAAHYIANYQITQTGRTFRAEVYHKQYQQLTKFDPAQPGNPLAYNNQGEGYARGLDIFWRDRQSVNNLDYWVSYSLLDTERNYQDFPTAAVPTFASKHNFSAVGKYFMTNWRTQLGAAYSFASGRPYFNPEQPEFHADRTKAFHSLSVNAAWLIRQHIILYAAATNVLGRDNVFGYNYASQPNESGSYHRVPVRPTAPRFFFVGLFITLSKDKMKNQLDTL
ncbi:TonB-dependent receptor [Tunicatimonas pelagia]|uniref:TonB-dependent receptor n=1 Tax=Tunicatimonas pelagia TaxID=931531 RepID=UPI00266595EB|nr:TonB-dependent receptor [Tunicatimonas pelagia]WKN41251.1 TonB-dependent receptor [Tunicatimonas pelagia]